MSCVSVWDPGGCTCGVTVTFLVRGCGNIPAPGVTVSVYDHAGGTLLASGTTDGTGHVPLSFAPGTRYVTCTGMSARFAAFAGTYALPSSGAATLTLSAAAGFACYNPCLIPLPTTLTATPSSLIGPVTLTWNAGTGTWSGSSPPGLNSYTFTLFNGGSFTVKDNNSYTGCTATATLVSTSCPMAFATHWHIPAFTCLFSGTWDITVTE